MNDSVADAAPPAVAGAAAAGNLLTEARNAAGLSIAEVGRQLKLSARQIEALEAGDYARLPGPVFVRGFIRNYARLLKLDAAPLLADIEGPALAAVVPATAESSPSTGVPFPGHGGFRWRPFAIGGLLVAAALVGYELYGDELTAPESDPRTLELPAPKVVVEGKSGELPPTGEAASQPTEIVPPAKTPPDASPTQAARSPDALPARTAKPPFEAPAPANAVPAPIIKVPATPTDARGGPAVAERVIRMVFSRDSWVEVRDRQGRTIFSQYNPAGTAQSVSGQPPLRLVVGNAAGVRLLYNDRTVDLAPYTQVDVARLTLE